MSGAMCDKLDKEGRTLEGSLPQEATETEMEWAGPEVEQPKQKESSETNPCRELILFHKNGSETVSRKRKASEPAAVLPAPKKRNSRGAGKAVRETGSKTKQHLLTPAPSPKLAPPPAPPAVVPPTPALDAVVSDTLVLAEVQNRREREAMLDAFLGLTFADCPALEVPPLFEGWVVEMDRGEELLG